MEHMDETLWVMVALHGGLLGKNWAAGELMVGHVKAVKHNRKENLTQLHHQYAVGNHVMI